MVPTLVNVLKRVYCNFKTDSKIKAYLHGYVQNMVVVAERYCISQASIHHAFGEACGPLLICIRGC